MRGSATFVCSARQTTLTCTGPSNVDHTQRSSSDRPDIRRESQFFIGHLHSTSVLIFRRTLLRYVRVVAYNIRLSSVCDVVAPYSEVELFGNIFALPNSLETGTVCIKILGKIIRRGSRGSCKLNTRGIKNWRSSTSRFISKTVKDGHSYNKIFCPRMHLNGHSMSKYDQLELAPVAHIDWPIDFRNS